VAADWHELTIPRRIMRPSVALASEQLDPRYSTQTPSQSATLGLRPVPVSYYSFLVRRRVGG